MATPTIKPSANIAIVWGTVNAAYGNNSNAMPNGMILETLQVTPKNGQPIDIEGGAGFTAIQVGIKDGFDARATAVYDSNKILPNEGDNIVCVVPLQNNAAGTGNVNCTFWSWSFTKARKTEKKIELFFTHRPDINT